MLPIDDIRAILAIDQQGMLRCVDQLPDVVTAAFERGAACSIPSGPFQDVFVCGMGGSAISGELLRDLVQAEAPFSVRVHRGDNLPAWVGAQTLGIFLSYSGNTAETLGAFREAIRRGVPSVLVTSGGEAEQLAVAAHIPVVKLAAGWQPRAALGDLYFSLLGLVSQLPGCPPLDVGQAVHTLTTARSLYGMAVPTEFNPAKKLAVALLGKTPLSLGTQGSTEAVVVRWKCQLNENAKTTTLAGILPEFTHNDIVNFTATQHPHVVIVCLQSPADSPLIHRQTNHTLDLLRPCVGGIFPVSAEGDSVLSRQLQHIMLGDYVSVYLGLFAVFDPTPVGAIT